MDSANMELVRHVLTGQSKSVNIVHDARSGRYVLKRRGFRDVVLSERAYHALLEGSALPVLQEATR